MNITLNRAITSIFGSLAFIAIAPPELQNQIPQVFPEKYRGAISLALAFGAFAAHSYGPPKPTPPATPAVQPAAPLIPKE